MLFKREPKGWIMKIQCGGKTTYRYRNDRTIEEPIDYYHKEPKNPKNKYKHPTRPSRTMKACEMLDIKENSKKRQVKWIKRSLRGL